ncbi:NAD(P)/FAD-dependent oxidoreductase [Actinosynnema sp. NPDC047251]|uniref:Monoamine oxidase n=1 Tax=Saccharothrix espanaensis (strain ATCC 51144 / DSM 44229 / JCM 9112 / NBRC 15066 / NRRL 15764) TaxID=1179773 RepID=K0JWD8_SACES|nr:NAD(P)/FAD-dependent oxidoreductase [Saccharothrix espanaensis]CCH32120.1 Monoamine oxidase [Saccharothrix espanaensis DSM 44229]
MSDHQSFRPALSRRGLLKGLGAGVLLAGAGYGAAHADTEIGGCDALVIGAGFAGITAARELRARGLNPRILEARSRIGGRTWTDTFAGVPVEMGGEAVDEKQPNVWREVQRYGIPLGTTLPAERLYMPQEFGVYDALPAAEVGPRLSQLFTPFFSGSQDMFPRPYEPLYRSDLVVPADSKSFRTRLDELGLTTAERLWVSGSFSGLAGGDSSRGAYTMLMQSWALSGHNFQGYLSVNTYHPTNGTQALLRAMLADARADVRFNSPVVSIEQTSSRVRVTTRGGQVYTAPVVVLAVPVNVWRNISFSPGLPAAYPQISTQGIGAPNVQKLWLLIEDDQGQFATQPPEGTVLGAVRPHTRTPEGLVMFGFGYDPNINFNDRAIVEQHLRRVVPNVRVKAVKTHNWATDPYALGGWSVRRPGQLAGPFPQVQQPRGRITFAGSDLANGWSGYIDGAIESGATAARQAAAVVGTPALAGVR